MKRFFLTPLLVVLTLYISAQNLPYWKDIDVHTVNTVKPRSAFMSYGNKKDALTGKYEKSKYYQLLNGVWKFYYVDAYQQLPDDITSPTLSTEKWKDINVPGNWEIQGFGEAIYTNHGYEFKPKNPLPPTLPEKNPVGVYRRDFQIPSDWKNRNVYLNLAGAKSGVYVYINGKEVGYNEDSKNPAEFLINDYLKDGKNILTLKIFRWSTGSYLECQDFLRISGIERDVYLWSQPKTALQDFRVTSTLDNSYQNGIFKLEMDIQNGTSEANTANVSYEIVDKVGNVIDRGTQSVSVPSLGQETVKFEKELPNIATWTSEHPNLYKLLMTVEQGGDTEYIPFNLGFRKIEIKESEYERGGKKQRLFYVNGQPIKLKGVNMHETDGYTGHYVSPEKLRRDLKLMKEHNINSIRCSHYPQDRHFYEMCDEFGFYVYDEANIESHGMYYKIYPDDPRKGSLGHEDGNKKGTLANNPDWLENHLYRINNMFQRNKNYPSVTIWSLGNEAGNGTNFYAAYDLLKELDKDQMARPVNYERALWEKNTDMYVPQYPTTAWLEEIGEAGADRPVVPSEYAHAMGNSTGDLSGQWAAIYRYPQLQGGYIWEWKDHSIHKVDPKTGRSYWAYGGDFGKDQPSDGNFMCDGLISPDQQLHPGMTEVKYAHQDVAFEVLDIYEGKFKVKNRFYFSNLDEYRISYKIYETNTLLQEGVLPLSVAPQDSIEVFVPLSAIKAKPGEEYFVVFEVKTQTPSPLIPVGYTVAQEQFNLQKHIDALPVKVEGKYPPLIAAENGEKTKILLYSKILSLTFDKKQGVITSLLINDKEYFAGGFGIQPNFWRGPTDNDYGNQMPKRLQIWKEASSNFKIHKTKVQEAENNNMVLMVDYLLPAGNHFIVNYRLAPSGILTVSTEFQAVGLEAEKIEASEAELLATASPKAAAELRAKNDILEVPRIGVRFRLPAEMNNITYLGRGPEENYVDRNKGTLIGLYNATAEDLYYPYARPQENGHHTDTRWMAATDKKGAGVLIKGNGQYSTFEFNALRNSVEDFDSENSTAPYQWNNFTPEEIKNRDFEKARNVKPKQTHMSDIEPRNFVEICIDQKHQGVGGFDSWRARPVAEATIYADQDYKFSFTFIPVLNTKDLNKYSKAVFY